MSSILSRSVLVLALVAFLSAFVSPAQAQDSGERIARRTIAHLGEAAQRTQALIHDATRRGSERLIALDREGATDEQLTAAARRATAQIQEIAGKGTERINGIARRGIAALEEIGADQALIDAVHEAQRRAAGAVASAARAGTQRIADLLERLLNN